MNFDYVPIGESGWIWIENGMQIHHADFSNVGRLACRRVFGLKDKYPEIFANIKYACVLEYYGCLDNSGNTTEVDFLKRGDILYVPEFNPDVQGLMPFNAKDQSLYKIESDGVTSTLLIENGVSIGDFLMADAWQTSSVPYVVTMLQDLRQDWAKTNAKIDATNIKLDSEIALAQGIRGAVADVKNAPTDTLIEPIYVGDRADKRRKSQEKIADLFAQGYRIHSTLGISEDLARILFVKYPEPNDANVQEDNSTNIKWEITALNSNEVAKFNILDQKKLDNWFMNTINEGFMMPPGSSPSPDGTNYEVNIRLSNEVEDHWNGKDLCVFIGSVENGMDMHLPNFEWLTSEMGIEAELASGVEQSIVTIKRPIEA